MHAARKSAAGRLRVALALVLVAVPVAAFDWTDQDCSRWSGTPQYRECVTAWEQLGDSDCSRWQAGGREREKCERARTEAETRRRFSGCVALPNGEMSCPPTHADAEAP
jgi:hypothetical protein